MSGNLLFCAFCGKTDSQVGHLIRGETMPFDSWLVLEREPGVTLKRNFGKISIPACVRDECVALCAAILQENKKGEAGATGSARNHKERSS